MKKYTKFCKTGGHIIKIGTTKNFVKMEMLMDCRRKELQAGREAATRPRSGRGHEDAYAAVPASTGIARPRSGRGHEDANCLRTELCIIGQYTRTAAEQKFNGQKNQDEIDPGQIMRTNCILGQNTR
jgi:hypothetical protein